MWIEILPFIAGASLYAVTPYAGVWIEILPYRLPPHLHTVTPYAGVWIEILISVSSCLICDWSLPTRECGLKYIQDIATEISEDVTPYAGVWIEIKHCPCNEF